MKSYIKLLHILTLVFFLSLALLPTLNERIHFISEEENVENRTKYPRPTFNVNHPDEYFTDFDKYYTDNFNLREKFIKQFNQFEFFVFKVSPVPQEVVVGKDGWFYEVKSAPNYKGVNLFTESQMVAIRKELALRTKWAEEKGIKYYLALVPNKMNIYPEYLPDKIIKISNITRYDQIVSLNNPPFVSVIDLKKNIIPHKNDGYDLYQHTDDHWNELGAYYGYEAIINRLRLDFPEFKAAPLTNYEMKIIERSGNMARMINEDKEFPEKFIGLIEKKEALAHDGKKRGYEVPGRVSEADYEVIKVIDNGKKLKCLIIRDSFTASMVKFIQEHFYESVFIFDEWKYRMREDLILKEKPDIVLNIVLETEVHKLLEFPFSLPGEHNLTKKIHLRAANGKFVSADESLDRSVIANRNHAANWETFNLNVLERNECTISTYDNHLFCSEIDKQGEIKANRSQVGSWETFTIILLDSNCAAFKATNGKYLSVDETTQLIYAKSDTIGKLEKFYIVPE